MWRRAAVGLLAVVLLAASCAAFLGIRLLRPQWLQPRLRGELTALGPAIGAADREDLERSFGAPGRIHPERTGTLIEFPSLGLSVRLDARSGRLFWYEYTSDRFRTARGIRVGAAGTDVTSAYGRPSTRVRLGNVSRLRYNYGVAFVLEFWLTPSERVDRIVFYQS